MNHTHAWIDIGLTTDIPPQGARRVQTGYGELAVFRTTDNRFFALENSCPHKKGPLSEGIVHGDRVTCPLHNWVIELSTGDVVGPDEGCATTVALKVEGNQLLLSRASLDKLLEDNTQQACAS